MLSVSDLISALPLPVGPSQTARHLAALLAVAIEQDRRTPDSLSCGEVAEALAITIDQLEAALVTLSEEGLVAVDPQGRLIVASPGALVRFASSQPARETRVAA